jgi:hypothetical protein
MGVSGAAFKMFWVPPWAECNCDLLIVGEEPIRRTFRALGYDYTYLPDRDRRNRLSKEFYRETISREIDRGVPVIAIGIVGPPEASVITGYDEGSDVLYGWSYFQENGSAYYRAADWYDNAYGLILIGAQKPAPPRQQVLLDALEWAITLTREPELDLEVPQVDGPLRCYSGLAAYDQMLAALAQGDALSAMSRDALTTPLHALVNDGAWLMMEKRRYAAEFLNEMADPAKHSSSELYKAAELYTRLSQVWLEAGKMMPWSDTSPDDILRLTDPKWRAEFAGYVRQAKQLEEQAIAHVECAVELLKNEPAISS